MEQSDTRSNRLQDQAADADAAVRDKLNDAQIPGYQAEFDPDEAERAGAFIEDALSEEDAIDSDLDLPDAMAAVQKQAEQ